MNNSLMTGTKVMNWKKARELAIEAMEQVGAHMDPDILVERLTVLISKWLLYAGPLLMMQNF